MQQLALIPRVEEGEIIPQRVGDGYISATALCRSVNKRFSDYKSLKSTGEFIFELINQTGLTEQQLIHTIVGGNPSLQGTWVHPYLAINLAQWLSPKFAVKVSQWVTEWQQGRSRTVMPLHIERYSIFLLIDYNRVMINFPVIEDARRLLPRPPRTCGCGL